MRGSSKIGRSRSPASPHVAPSRFEGPANWDEDFNWPFVQNLVNHPQPTSVSSGYSRFLFEAEDVLRELNGVRLVNTDEAGTLLITNYRLVFLTQAPVDIIALGTIPFATVDKFSKIAVKQMSGSRHSDKSSGSAQRFLQIHGC